MLSCSFRKYSQCIYLMQLNLSLVTLLYFQNQQVRMGQQPKMSREQKTPAQYGLDMRAMVYGSRMSISKTLYIFTVSNISFCQIFCSEKGCRAGISMSRAILLHFLPLERLLLLWSAFLCLSFQRIPPWCSFLILTLLLKKDSLFLETSQTLRCCQCSIWLCRPSN